MIRFGLIHQVCSGVLRFHFIFIVIGHLLALSCARGPQSRNASPPSFSLSPFGSFLAGPVEYQGRVSSADPTGANADYVQIAPGDVWRLPVIEGPGEITRLWLTCAGEPYRDKFAVVRAYWDGAAVPAVEVPLGDFFLMGDGQTWRVDALPIQVTRPGGGYTSYFVMPFKKEAVIEIVNEGAGPLAFWIHADYRRGRLAPHAPYFHARYRQEFPARGWGDIRPSLIGTPASAERANFVPSDPADNYTILDVRGAGYYLGCYLIIENNQFGWVGEGDDRIVVDGEAVPRYLGTGLEDYFGSGFGFQRGQSPLFGVLNTHAGLEGYMHSAYRFHWEDPVRFAESIHVSVEHGEANHRSDDYASVAYFYLDTSGGGGRDPLPPAAARLTSEMTERLLLIRAFDELAGLERRGDYAAALEQCERAIADSAIAGYTEFLELKKGGLLIRAGRMEEARGWLAQIMPRQTNRDRREFAAALIEWLDDPDPHAALLHVRGDDVVSCSVDGAPPVTGDLHRAWDVHSITLPPGRHAVAASVYNIGYFGGLAALILPRGAPPIVTGEHWIASGEAITSPSLALRRQDPVTQTRLYGHPAGPIRTPWDITAFHILGADAPWIWGRINNLPDQMMHFYYEWECKGEPIDTENDSGTLASGMNQSPP